jgi:hypothetical protein
MTIDDAISILATESFLSPSGVDALCNHFECPRPVALDTLARDVAQRYMDGHVSFEIADAFMNSMFAHAVRGSEIPRFMYSVYEAFDAGEYHHQQDPLGTDSEEKYTRPQLARILSDDKIA